jgi:hypothetical protein
MQRLKAAGTSLGTLLMVIGLIDLPGQIQKWWHLGTLLSSDWIRILLCVSGALFLIFANWAKLLANWRNPSRTLFKYTDSDSSIWHVVVTANQHQQILGFEFDRYCVAFGHHAAIIANVNPLRPAYCTQCLEMYGMSGDHNKRKEELRVAAQGDFRRQINQRDTPSFVTWLSAGALTVSVAYAIYSARFGGPQISYPPSVLDPSTKAKIKADVWNDPESCAMALTSRLIPGTGAVTNEIRNEYAQNCKEFNLSEQLKKDRVVKQVSSISAKPRKSSENKPAINH